MIYEDEVQLKIKCKIHIFGQLTIKLHIISNFIEPYMTKNSLSDILHSMLNKFGKVSHLGIIGHIIIKLSQFHMSEK